MGRFCQLALNIFDNGIVDHVFRTTPGDATTDLTEIGTAYVELVGIGGNVAFDSKLLTYKGHKVVVKLCATALQNGRSSQLSFAEVVGVAHCLFYRPALTK